MAKGKLVRDKIPEIIEKSGRNKRPTLVGRFCSKKSRTLGYKTHWKSVAIFGKI